MDRCAKRCWQMQGLHSLLLLLVIAPAHAVERDWKPPRTEHGQPDLQGFWDFGTKTPFERPTALGEKRAYTKDEALEFERKAREANQKMDAPIDLSKGAPVAGGQVGQEADADSMERRHDLTRVGGEYRTSIIIDPPNGRLPKRKEFVDFFGAITARNMKPTDGPDTLDGPTRCLATFPVPTIFPVPWNALLQIVQTKEHVVLHTEMIHDARMVRLNGTHPAHKMKLWYGDSIGHFDGNTLIVHTRDFRAEQSYAFIMTMSEELELIERFTRVGKDEVVYSFTVTDAAAYTRPFTGERTLQRARPSDRMLEFACHEGNYAMAGILAGTRKQEQDAAAKAEPVSTAR